MKIIAWLELDVPGYPYRMERELTIPDSERWREELTKEEVLDYEFEEE